MPIKYKPETLRAYAKIFLCERKENGVIYPPSEINKTAAWALNEMAKELEDLQTCIGI